MQIPQFGLGTYKLDKNIVYDITYKALNLGYTHIDTAQLYRNEKEIGRAIQNINRNKIFITTKIMIKNIEKGEQKMIKSVIKSLCDLNTDYIDLLLLHGPTSNNNSWKTMEKIQNGEIDKLKNKIRFIGVSNYNVQELQEILKTCVIKPYANQFECSPFLINNRRELINFCNDNGIKIIAHSCLTKGMKLDTDILTLIANKYKISTASLLIKWALHNNLYVIPRTSKEEHLEENINCYFSDIRINNDDIMLLEKEIGDVNFITHEKYI